MTNLERQLEAAKKFEASKNNNVDLRANAREARENLDLELARAKQEHKNRRSGLNSKRAEASKEWTRKQQEEADRKKRADALAKAEESEYEYVYLDEDGNYYQANEDNEEEEDEEDEEEDDEEEVAAVTPARAAGTRVTPTTVLAHGYAKAFSDQAFFALRRNDLADFLPEIQSTSSCLFRNVSHVGRSRDDHQVGHTMSLDH